MEINEDMLSYLDRAAYNCPDRLPPTIIRNDKTPYRLYFRFMVCIYKLHNTGTVPAEELKKLKDAFVQDFMVYELHHRASVKSIRDMCKMEVALTDCRKNSDNCELCKAVSHIWGTPDREHEQDIEVDNGN